LSVFEKENARRSVVAPSLESAVGRPKKAIGMDVGTGGVDERIGQGESYGDEIEDVLLGDALDDDDALDDADADTDADADADLFNRVLPIS
jgi:hypothetical protein